MMNRVLTFIFIIATITLTAADDKQYLDADFNVVTQESSAMYYRLVSKSSDGLYNSHVYYLNEVLQMKGKYLEEELLTLHGECSFYYKNGQTESEGQYDHGRRSGLWKRYDLFGEPKADKYYPTNEEIAQDKFKTCMASFVGGKRELDAYLIKNLVYPKETIYQGKHLGEVNINIELDEEGYVVGYDVLASNSELFSKEAIRLVTQMPKWNPALRDGRPVASSYIISIPFVHVKPLMQQVDSTSETKENTALEEK